jgi:hypothetical protein
MIRWRMDVDGASVTIPDQTGSGLGLCFSQDQQDTRLSNAMALCPTTLSGQTVVVLMGPDESETASVHGSYGFQGNRICLLPLRSYGRQI